MSILENNADLSDLIRDDEHAQSLIAESQQRQLHISQMLRETLKKPLFFEITAL